MPTILYKRLSLVSMRLYTHMVNVGTCLHYKWLLLVCMPTILYKWLVLGPIMGLPYGAYNILQTVVTGGI